MTVKIKVSEPVKVLVLWNWVVKSLNQTFVKGCHWRIWELLKWSLRERRGTSTLPASKHWFEDFIGKSERKVCGCLSVGQSVNTFGSLLESKSCSSTYLLSLLELDHGLLTILPINWKPLSMLKAIFLSEIIFRKSPPLFVGSFFLNIWMIPIISGWMHVFPCNKAGSSVIIRFWSNFIGHLSAGESQLAI